MFQPDREPWRFEVDDFSSRRGDRKRTSGHINTVVCATWIPGWYELDQPLEVGVEREFVFWRVVPNYLGASESLVFYNTLWHEGDGVFGTGKISIIRHPDLGDIRKIDTRGLDYTIKLMDSTELLVNAEEEPGKMFEGRSGDWTESNRVISDWQCDVTFEALSELSTESKCLRTKQ